MSRNKCTAQQAAERLTVVRSNAGFIAFCRVVGLRLRSGRSLDALRMIQAVGCTPSIAHKIIEGWEVDRAWHLSADACEELKISRSVLSAIRFSYFINGLERYNWPELLTLAATHAKEAKQNGKD